MCIDRSLFIRFFRINTNLGFDVCMDAAQLAGNFNIVYSFFVSPFVSFLIFEFGSARRTIQLPFDTKINLLLFLNMHIEMNRKQFGN